MPAERDNRSDRPQGDMGSAKASARRRSGAIVPLRGHNRSLRQGAAESLCKKYEI